VQYYKTDERKNVFLNRLFFQCGLYSALHFWDRNEVLVLGARDSQDGDFRHFLFYGRGLCIFFDDEPASVRFRVIVKQFYNRKRALFCPVSQDFRPPRRFAPPLKRGAIFLGTQFIVHLESFKRIAAQRRRFLYNKQDSRFVMNDTAIWYKITTK
jgi:hypothetical protein